MLPCPATSKRQGEAAEALFLAKATDLGLTVAKVWGDSAPYDFIVEGRHACRRIQVKSVWAPRMSPRHSFKVAASRGRGVKRAYSSREVDFMVIYIAAERAWYVIPIRALAGHKTVCLDARTRSRRLFEAYREAWKLL